MASKKRKLQQGEAAESDTLQKGIQTTSPQSGMNSDPSELRIVLIEGRFKGQEEVCGRNGSVGNVILDELVFDRCDTTVKSVMKQKEVSGRQITVVDTPGWYFDCPLDLTPKLTQLEIQQGVYLCPPGPNAFVLVVPLNVGYGIYVDPDYQPHVDMAKLYLKPLSISTQIRMSVEEHVTLLSSLLGDQVWRRTIVVFTVPKLNISGSDHYYDGSDLNFTRAVEDFIKSDPNLRDLTKKCDGRFHFFEMVEEDSSPQLLPANRSRVTELLEKMDQMVTSNGCHCEIEKSLEELKEMKITIERRAEQRMADSQKQTGLPTDNGLNDVRILLMGRCGSRKAGNNLVVKDWLDDEPFWEEPEEEYECLQILPHSVVEAGVRSVRCNVKQGRVAGRDVTVVDSPGWWYNSPVQDTSEMDKLEIQDSVSLCFPGPHAVLLTVPLLEAFTKAQRVAVEEHMALLSQRVWSYTIVVFTVPYILRGASIEQHIEAEGEDLRWLVDKCGNRYHVLYYDTITDLLKKIEEMVAGNGGGHYENDDDVCEKVSEMKKNIQERVRALGTSSHKRRELGEKPQSRVRVLLAGGQQYQRTRAMNLIMQDNGFTEYPYKEFKAQTKLTKCVRQRKTVKKRNMTVVNCPDWSTTPPSQKTKDVLLHGVTLCSPGPHAVLLTVSVRSRFSEADRRSVEEHMELLGDSVWRDTLVLFMEGWWLGERRVEEYIGSEGEPLRRILEKCGYRYHVLHGLKWDMSQVAELMEKIEDMVTNRGHTGPPDSREDRSVRDTGRLQVLQTECYTLSHNPRGTCLIINNENFRSDLLRLEKRTGTLKDEEALKRVFSKLGFKVKVQRDLTAEDIRNVLRDLGKQNFTNADALVVCVLTHGTQGCVLGTDGVQVLLCELKQPFEGPSAPTLAGKPKLFFIQACQGDDHEWALPLLREDGPSRVPRKSVSQFADFLMGMAVREGITALRRMDTGSFYIQELCRQLEKAAFSGEDIHSALTAVHREVGKEEYDVVDPYNGVQHSLKQMPECRHSLTKKLVLNFIDGTGQVMRISEEIA